MTVTLTHDTDLQRVRVEASGLDSSAETATVERSRNEVQWTTVRGAAEVAVSGGELVVPVDDYEFWPDVENFYRVTAFDGSGGQTDQETDSITPSLEGRVWLKSITQPFLNLSITSFRLIPVRRHPRHGVFDVVGRSLPVAVTDVRGSRELHVQAFVQSRAERENLDYLLASGDPVFLQVPPGFPTESLYAVIGETQDAERIPGDRVHLVDLPLREVAPPGPGVVGSTVQWQTILNNFATWADVLAEFPTWADVLEFVADPSDVIVP